MALQTEVWSRDIQETLWANNSFMSQIGMDDSQYLANKTVHLPQSGLAPAVKKNRAVFPAQVTERTDSEVTYNLDQYTTDPIMVTMLEELQNSYDKRQSVLKQHVQKLSNAMANNTLYEWAPTLSPRVVLTSGTTAANALAPGATGNRKALVLADIQEAVRILDNDNVDPNDERFLILPANLYWKDFLNNTTLTKYLEYGTATLPTGKVPMIFGLKILVRSSVLVTDSSQVLKVIGDDGNPTATATTDNLGALVVSSSYVRKALGSPEVFSAEKRPEWYGDIFSALVMQGACKARTNQEGVVLITQN